MDLAVVEGTSTPAGRQGWFEARARACERDLYVHALWMVRAPAIAEELVQEAMVRAWRSPRTPQEPDEFRAWLFRITANLCRSHLRRERLQQTLRFWVRDEADPLAEWERRHGDPELMAAMRALKPRERAAVYLSYYEDRSHADVAATLGVSEGASRVLVHRALAKLRRQLGEDVPRADGGG